MKDRRFSGQSLLFNLVAHWDSQLSAAGGTRSRVSIERYCFSSVCPDEPQLHSSKYHKQMFRPFVAHEWSRLEESDFIYFAPSRICEPAVGEASLRRTSHRDALCCLDSCVALTRDAPPSTVKSKRVFCSPFPLLDPCFYFFTRQKKQKNSFPNPKKVHRKPGHFLARWPFKICWLA